MIQVRLKVKVTERFVAALNLHTTVARFSTSVILTSFRSLQGEESMESMSHLIYRTSYHSLIVILSTEVLDHIY